jgi:hypothetical protein
MEFSRDLGGIVDGTRIHNRRAQWHPRVLVTSCL